MSELMRVVIKPQISQSPLTIFNNSVNRVVVGFKRVDNEGSRTFKGLNRLIGRQISQQKAYRSELNSTGSSFKKLIVMKLVLTL